MKIFISVDPRSAVAMIMMLGLLLACWLNLATVNIPISITPSPTRPIPLIGSGGIETSAPTATLTPTKMATVTVTPTRPASATPALSSRMMRVKVFLIAVGDRGKSGAPTGCGDSLVSVERMVPRSVGVLKAALTALLEIHDATYGDTVLYNALYQSNLEVTGVSVKGGKATVTLSGTLTLNDPCDSNRVVEQIRETARQFATVEQVELVVNGLPLEHGAFSLRSWGDDTLLDR